MKQYKLIFSALVLLIAGLSACKKANDIKPAVTIWNRGDVANEVRNGVLLTLSFDETNLEFSGTLINQNSTVATNARVEVHTFDPNNNPLFEYGPSTPTDMQPGDTLNIVLSASNAGNFTTFTMHAEIGTQAGSGG